MNRPCRDLPRAAWGLLSLLVVLGWLLLSPLAYATDAAGTLPGCDMQTLSVSSLASPTEGWAVGASASSAGRDFAACHWDGTAWSQASPPDLPNRSINVLKDVSEVSPNDVWAVGYAGCQPPACNITFSQAVIEHWDGTGWNLVLPTADEIAHPDQYDGMATRVWALSANDVLVFGAGGSPWYTNANEDGEFIHWDGSNWTLVPGSQVNVMLTGGPQPTFLVLSDSDMWWWIAGNRTTIQGGRQPVYHWDGTSWNSVDPLSVGDNWTSIDSIAGSASNDLWATGAACCDSSFRQYTITEHWDGTGWSPVSSPSNASDTTAALTAVSASASGDALATGIGGDPHPVAEEWNGSHWTSIAKPPFKLGRIRIASLSNAWGSSGLSVARWNGTRWINLTPPPPNTTITKQVIAKRAATFDFTGSGGRGSLHFQCKLGSGSWKSCVSPKTYTGLTRGRHTFEVRAIDARSEADPSPARHTFRI